jgi:virulence-associated protein VapD
MKYKGLEKSCYVDVQNIVERLHKMNEILGSVYLDEAILMLIRQSYETKDLRNELIYRKVEKQ